tara:strand:- start:47397 stop:47570 length:174 start_codon:yes stop_codon:yes gene_type:complete
MPDALLVDPCEISPAGDTVRSLAEGYIKNTSCVKQYRLLLDKQRQYKTKIIEVYEDG